MKMGGAANIKRTGKRYLTVWLTLALMAAMVFAAPPTVRGSGSWVAQDSGSTNLLYDVAFVDANTGWAVGWGGTILKYTNAPQIKSPAVAVSPNPFSPDGDGFQYRTTVSFSLSQPATVTAEVLNQAGDTVKTLRAGKPADTSVQYVPWDGTDQSGSTMPSGGYTFRMTGQRRPGADVGQGSYTYGVYVTDQAGNRALVLSGPRVV
jgi:hypothetical protein